MGVSPEFKRRIVEFKEKQKIHFDIWHNTKEAPEMPHPAYVWVNSIPEPVRGTVIVDSLTSRSPRVRSKRGRGWRTSGNFGQVESCPGMLRQPIN